MTPLTLAAVAMVLALTAFVGFIALLTWTIRHHRTQEPLEPPVWVNQGRRHRPTRRGHWREDCRR